MRNFKISNMKSGSKGRSVILWTFIVSVFVFFSCDDNGFSDLHGLGLMDSDSYIEMIDTFTVNTSTVYLDSIATSGDNYGLVGFVEDTISGSLSAETYFKLEWSSATIEDYEWCDSMILELPLADYYLGDTTSYIDVFVHEVTGDYELPDEGYFFNNHSIAYDPSPVGQISFCPEDADTLLQVKFSEAFAERIFDILQNRDFTENPDLSLQDYLKGLVVRTENSGNLLFGIDFSTKVQMALYASRPSEYGAQRKIEIDYDEDRATDQFNHIEMDFTSSKYPLLKDLKEIPASETQDRCLIIPGGNVYTKVKLPTLGSILEISEVGAVLSAELVFEPELIELQFNDYPKNLLLYEAGKYNYIESVIKNGAGNTAYGSLIQDDYYDEETSYSFDLSNYVITELSDYYIDQERSILISIADTANAQVMNHLYLMGESMKFRQPKLKIYYLHL